VTVPTDPNCFLEALDGQVALVIGATSGIGRAVVDAFLRCGAHVVAFGRSEEKLRDLVASNQSLARALATYAGDATDPHDLDRAATLAVDRFGKLDTLVCTVGAFDYYRTILDYNSEALSSAFEELFRINVLSYILAVRATLPHLLRQPSSIVLTLSTASFYPEGGGVLYGASKFATRGLVVHLAYELAPRIRVNGVAPGGTIGTHLRGLASLHEQDKRVDDAAAGRAERIQRSVPLQVAATPADHTAAFVYLASHRLSRVVTGAIINTDGGRGVAGTVRVAHLVEEI